MKLKMTAKVLSSVASVFVLFAPVFSQTMLCAFFWGEPEVPDCLK